MATKQTKELFASTPDQLHTTLQEMRVRLLELNIQKTASALKNVKEIHRVRKTIARILTIVKLKATN